MREDQAMSTNVTPNDTSDAVIGPSPTQPAESQPAESHPAITAGALAGGTPCRCDRAATEPHLCDCLGMCACHVAAIEAMGYRPPPQPPETTPALRARVRHLRERCDALDACVVPMVAIPSLPLTLEALRTAEAELAASAAPVCPLCHGTEGGCVNCDPRKADAAIEAVRLEAGGAAEADVAAILREIGIDPDAPSSPSAHLCGACRRGEHANCSGWCWCPLGCRDAAEMAVATAPASPPVDSVSSRRIVANRSELFASALRRLASDLEAAAQRPSDTKMQSILEADRTEAVGAGERLEKALPEGNLGDLIRGEMGEDVGGRDGKPRALASSQASALRRSPLRAPALALRQWADRWDAYAMAIDP